MSILLDGTNGITIPGTGTVILNGATSGTATLQSPAVAGSTTITLPATTGTAALAAQLRGYRAGFVLSTAGSSTTMTSASGTAIDSTNAVIINLSSSMGKTTSAWAAGTGNGGLDTGTIANSTGYHFYVIAKTDGTTDVVFSTTAPTTGPSLPSGYTYWRWIGWGKTNGSAQWTSFTQIGNRYHWAASVADYNAAPGTTSAVLQALTVPNGINVTALFNGVVTFSSANTLVYFSSPNNPDEAPSTTATPFINGQGYNIGLTTFGSSFALMTNTSAQIRFRSNDVNSPVRIGTLGWEIPANASY